ncbi:hypothetical protein FBF30_01545 [Candidatus Saccharibacteria bacterium oral taxon 955]|nr:hypothetical protein FBF30_01545 [Candidatus Saccharibacteria bacterium oral taxon 955]
MQSITVTPEMWYCGSLSDEPGQKDGGLADVDLLRKAGFTAACKRLSSPSLATLSRCRGQYLELDAEVTNAFFSATSCGISYPSCWAPIDKSVPKDGAIPRSVAESVIKARASGFFRKFMVVSYQRTIGRDNEGHKEWAVVGCLCDEGSEHRFLIAYWAERGMTPPSLGVIRALAQEERDRKKLNEERDYLKDSLESALEANKRRRRYGVYKLRWLGVGLVTLTTAVMPFVAPPWMFWVPFIFIMVTGLISFMMWLDDDIYSGGMFGAWRRAILGEWREPEDVISEVVPRKTIRGYRRRLKEIDQQIDRF